jgi:flagellar protein FlaJ
MVSKEKPKTQTPHPFVSAPTREVEVPKDPTTFKSTFLKIASFFPNLKNQLIQADLFYTPAGYVKNAVVSAFFLSLTLLFLLFMFLRSNDAWWLILLIAFPFVYILSFFYFMSYPKVKANMRAKKLEEDLVFAGRHMLIELKGGVPLFDAMLGITHDYGEVSLEFNKVVEKVTLGVPMGVALHEVANNNPSPYFKRILLQIANSLSSGSDVAAALEASLDQISNEQVIALKSYGQKLNPFVMFFMIFGIILPSLGVAFLIIISSFLGSSIQFSSNALFLILLVIALVQFIFLSVVESSRPKFIIVD